jgi:peptide/nickel transport system substrate-binding protein
VAALLGALALAGCGAGGSSTSKGTITGAVGGEGEGSGAPHVGGTLSMAQQEEAASLNPLEAIQGSELNITSQINEPLWKENTEGKLVPWLISKVKTSEGQKVWTLTLRKGVEFSTGQPMTSADVLFSLEAARKSADWESLLEGISKVEATNPETVVITNSKPAAELPSLLSQWSFGIMPKNFGGESEKEFASKPIGTGPFMLGSWKRGETLTLEKNPHYWQQGKPYLDKVEIKTVTDPNSRVTQLEGGQLDLIYAPPWSQVEGIEAGSETAFAKFPLGYLKMLQMNSRFPLFQNEKVREAVQLALDREGMVEAVLRGNGEPAASIVPPPVEFHNPNMNAPEHNIEKAKELVVEAVKEGVSPSFSIAMPNEDDFWLQGAQIAQQNLEEAGFTVKIDKLDGSSWFELLESGKYQMAAGHIYSAVPTPTEVFGAYNSLEANFTGIPTDETEKLFAEAMSEPNKAKRQQLYYELQEVVANEKYIAPAIYEPFAWAYRTDVSGLYVGRVGIPWLEVASINE